MSLEQLKSVTENILALCIIAGVLIIIGTIGTMVIGVYLNPYWILSGVTLLFPLFIAGIILIVFPIKVLEIMS